MRGASRAWRPPLACSRHSRAESRDAAQQLHQQPGPTAEGRAGLATVAIQAVTQRTRRERKPVLFISSIMQRWCEQLDTASNNCQQLSAQQRTPSKTPAVRPRSLRMHADQPGRWTCAGAVAPEICTQHCSAGATSAAAQRPPACARQAPHSWVSSPASGDPAVQQALGLVGAPDQAPPRTPRFQAKVSTSPVPAGQLNSSQLLGGQAGEYERQQVRPEPPAVPAAQAHVRRL